MSAVHESFNGKNAPENRVQEVWTPEWIWDAVKIALGGEIACDPCAASKPEGWRAQLNITKPGAFQGLVQHNGMTGVCLDARGEDWDFPTIYVNPPYNDLRAWLEACCRAAYAGRAVVALVPDRARRKWWCDLTRSGERVMLAPVKFVGHSGTHLENMCLVAWRCVIPDLGKRENERHPVVAPIPYLGAV